MTTTTDDETRARWQRFFDTAARGVTVRRGWPDAAASFSAAMRRVARDYGLSDAAIDEALGAKHGND